MLRRSELDYVVIREVKKRTKNGLGDLINQPVGLVQRWFQIMGKVCSTYDEALNRVMEEGGFGRQEAEEYVGTLEIQEWNPVVLEQAKILNIENGIRNIPGEFGQFMTREEILSELGKVVEGNEDSEVQHPHREGRL